MKVKELTAQTTKELSLMFKNLYEFIEACSLTVLLAGDVYLYLHTRAWWRYPLGFSAVFVAQRAAQLWVRELRKQ